MFDLHFFKRPAQPFYIAVFVTLVSAHLFIPPLINQASAVTKDAALESCRQSVGKPIVQPCMKAGGSFESCRAIAGPKVRACVQAALGSAGNGPAGPSGSKAGSVANRTSSPAAAAVGRGRALVDQGKYAAAVTTLDEAINQDPRSAFAYAWRGTAKARMGQFGEATTDYDEALKLDPQNVLALSGRGYSLFMLKDNGRGLADLNAASEIDPTSPAPFAFRGLIYSDMGEQERALTELNTALKLNPNFAPAHAGLGAAYNKQQEYEKAIPAFNKALALTPQNIPSLSGRGFTYLSLGDYDQAISDLTEAIKLNPKFVRPYINRGRAYLGKGKLSDAIADFDEALRLEPKSVPALLQRANAYERSRDLTKARGDFQYALSIVPSHPVAVAGIERIDNKIAASTGQRPVNERTGARVALVIGNSRYETFDTLANPERDAKLMAEALSKSGFEKVQLVVNGTRDSVAAALRSFANEARNADWAMVYFAGHGIELDGSNYLVPVDAKFEEDSDIPKESIALDQVLNAVGAAGKMRLVVLDACRENPFVKDLNKGSTSAAGRGLARIEPESGTLVAFATKHGHVATDGAGENSPFAASLVQRMETAGLEINQLFRLVHDDVYASTQKKQEPFTYGQLSAQGFYFKAR